MVKKKRQSDPSENGDDSTESCDENVKSACPHVAKAVDLTRLKKSLKSGGFDKECSECKKTPRNEISDTDYEEDLSLWMCLRCGSQLCGRARNKHALNHYNTPHSDCHALTANTTSWDIYCYNCNNEVTSSSSKKLHECIEYLKKQSMVGGNPKSMPPIELPYEIDSKTELVSVDNYVKKTDKVKDKAMALNLPRVRGLSNLGNTCFFNSVMQCLAQTPYLLQVLQVMSTPGEKFTLPGGKLKLKGEGDELKDVDLPPITGQLSEWGTLTRTLAETLTDLHSGEGGVYTPRKLLMCLVNKLPQFSGGDQHDAHELLRHMLEAVRSEDLRRYQSVILNSLGMSSKVDPAKVDGEVKQKVKFYGQQASDTMLRPEQVFRGFLVSTLECQECYHQSDRAEYFLDLSLPVATCRPQPPAVVRRKTPNEDNMYNTQDENKPSKHQMRMERNAARKAARKNKGNSTSKEENSMLETNGQSKEDGKLSSESDADVEDNLEEPSRAPDHMSVGTQASVCHTAANFAAYHMESGYNSEKVVSSDSIRTSPVDHDTEKADNTPEHTDKDKTDFCNTATAVAIPLDYKPLASLENLSNPDSGVASPEATKHNSTETVDDVGSPADGKEAGRCSPASSAHASPTSSPRASPSSSPRASPSNELVLKGISVRGSRTLLQAGGEPGPESAPSAPPAPLAPRPKLTGADFPQYSRQSPPAGRYVGDEDECSVQSCLSQFTALELLTGNNKVGCETCTERINGKGGKTVYTNATKRFLVSSPPAVLILHLKRFQLGPRCMFRKMTKHVDFGTVLDLAPFCAMDKLQKLPNVSRGQSSLLYALYGVVEHSGGMHGGHYVAYVKARRGQEPHWFLPRGANTAPAPPAAAARDDDSDLSGYESGEGPPTPAPDPAPAAAAAPTPAPGPEPGVWYYVSDSMVSEVSEEKVLRAQAYLLFYERIL